MKNDTLKLKHNMRASVNHPHVRILVFGHKEFSQLFGTMTTYYQGKAVFHIVDAIVGSLNEVNQHVERLRPDVIISAGSNAAYLQSNLTLPVLSLPVTDSDVIRATTRAAKVARQIKLISYDRHDELIPLLEAALSVKEEHATYNTAKQAREQFYLLKASDDIVVVGASLICDLAAQNGIKSFMYYSAESCRQVIEQAIQIGKHSTRHRFDKALSDWAIQQSSVPLCWVDTKQHQVVTNELALQVFDLNRVDQSLLQACLIAVNQADGEQGRRPTMAFNGREFGIAEIRAVDSDVWLLCLESAPYDSQSVSPITVAKSKTDLVYSSSAINHLMEKVQFFAQSPSNVLITGESGTGKELIARAIHQHSQYTAGNFVALNCSAIPAELFEGELFGHTDGAYTGSRKGGRKGLIAEAQNGALFLDEVSELTLEQQAKLLRFIQERSYRPVGGNQEMASDLKLIAATNTPLNDLVEQGRFRHDLFYRLNVLNLAVPALRSRPDDIAAIAYAKLELFLARSQLKHDPRIIIDEILPALLQYSWPGNVRELENILERLTATLGMATDACTYRNLLEDIAPEFRRNIAPKADSLVATKELELVAKAMDMFDGDKQRVADYLGMSQTTLWRRLKRLNQQYENPSFGETHAEL